LKQVENKPSQQPQPSNRKHYCEISITDSIPLSKPSKENALQRYVQQGEGFKEILDVCDEYISLIKQHIAKENHVFFPMGESVTPVDERKNVECYEHIEHHEIGHETHHRLEKLAENI